MVWKQLGSEKDNCEAIQRVSQLLSRVIQSRCIPCCIAVRSVKVCALCVVVQSGQQSVSCCIAVRSVKVCAVCVVVQSGQARCAPCVL